MKLAFYFLFCSIYINTFSNSSPVFSFFGSYLDHFTKRATKEKCDIPLGKNQRMSCSINSKTKTCTAMCSRGYEFPNGEDEFIIICTKDDGIYYPTDEFPNCYYKGMKN
ncbi:uncharacterized protein [Centruroides vittatus]|uniref:uncharacterized protein n=1 Tax=Centruroides vittatus TaxID=120091 RepID=UPI00350F6E6C